MIVRSLHQLTRLHGRIAIDVETYGSFQPWRGTLLGLGIWCEAAGIGAYVPLYPEPICTLEQLRGLFNTLPPGTQLIGHNLKYELKWLSLTRQDLEGLKLWDTMVAEHLLGEERAKNLEALELRYLKTRSKTRFLEASEQYGGIKNTNQWPLKLLAEYCINDCRVTYEIARHQRKELRNGA